jgi:hypothetical protein
MKELVQLSSPAVRRFRSGAASIAAPAFLLFVEEAGTLNNERSTVLLADPELDAEETVQPESTESRASFQWPPDCLWPFDDRGAAGEN